MNKIKKNPLFFAFLFPAVLDMALTLIGQSGSYYSGMIRPNEASPAYYFLLASPWFYLFGSLAWFVMWYWIFRKISEGWKMWFMFIFISGHSWGTSSWLMKLLPFSPQIKWILILFYLAIVAKIASRCVRMYFKDNLIYSKKSV